MSTDIYKCLKNIQNKRYDSHKLRQGIFSAVTTNSNRKDDTSDLQTQAENKREYQSNPYSALIT